MALFVQHFNSPDEKFLLQIFHWALVIENGKRNEGTWNFMKNRTTSQAKKLFDKTDLK
jgi:RNA-binding protein YlmH